MNSRRRIFIRYFAVFALVFTAGLITLALMQAAPFGSSSAAALDMADQYISLYYQRANVSSLQDFLYTWKGALGTNSWVLSSYYTNSIFVIFLRHLSFAQMLTALDIILMLKPAIAAVTGLLFLDYKFRNDSIIHIGGAVAYALSAWTSAFLQQIMWTDLLFLVPLVLYGFERLLRERKGLLYTLCLSLALSANFYIAYEVCLFLVLYFFYEEFAESRINVHEIGRNFIRFILYSLLAAGMAAVVLLPTAIALSKTILENDAPKVIMLYRSWSAYLKMLMPGQMSKLWTDGVNISVGILALIFTPLFFFSGKYSLRDKIGSAAFLVLMFASMNCNVLDYVWHDFHFPRFLPGRWTFLFALFMVILSCKGLHGLGQVKPSLTVVSLLVSAAVIGYAAWRKDLGSSTSLFFYVVAALATALILLFRLPALGERNRRKLEICIPIILALMQSTECCANFCQVTASNDENIKYAKMDNYAIPAEKYNKAAATVAPGVGEFYRTDIAPAFTDNSSMLANYYGIGYFCSMMPENSYRFFQWLGLSYYTKNISVIANDASPFVTSLFGVRYFLDFSDQMQQLTPYVAYRSTAASYRTWENPYALSLGFPVNSKAEDLDISKEDKAWGLEHQNAMLQEICHINAPLFNRIEPCFMDTYNTVLNDQGGAGEGTCRKIRDGDKETVSIEYSVEKDGPMYLEHKLSKGNLIVQLNGNDVLKVNCWRPAYYYIETCKKGDIIRVVYNAKQDDTLTQESFGMELFQMDENVFNNAYNQLSQNNLEVTDFGATKVKAKVHTDKQSLYMTSIPQDGGWEVFIDGKKAQTSTICGALLGFSIPEGEHSLVFRYHVSGLGTGAVLSALSWLIFLLLHIGGSRKRKKGTGNKIAAGALMLTVVLFSLTAIPQNVLAVNAGEANVVYLNKNADADVFWHQAAAAYQQDTGTKVGIINIDNSDNNQTMKRFLKRNGLVTMFSIDGYKKEKALDSFCIDLDGTDPESRIISDNFLLRDNRKYIKALGYDYFTYGIVVNVPLLNKAGYSVDQIKDQESLIKAVKDIQKNRRQLGIQGAFAALPIGNSSISKTAALLLNLPIYYEEQEQKTMDLQSFEGNLSGFKNLLDLFLQNGTIPSAQMLHADNNETLGEFVQKKAVFYLGGSWDYPMLKQYFKDEELAVIPVYYGTEDAGQGLCSGSTSYWCVNKKASNAGVQASLDFMSWLIGSEKGVNLMASYYDMFPYRNRTTGGNLFYETDQSMTKDGKTGIPLQSSMIPSDEWMLSFMNALIGYAKGNDDWANIEALFRTEWK